MAAAPGLAVALVGAAIAGGGNGIEAVAARTTLQEQVEPSWMAMMMSLNESMYQAVPGRRHRDRWRAGGARRIAGGARRRGRGRARRRDRRLALLGGLRTPTRRHRPRRSPTADTRPRRRRPRGSVCTPVRRACIDIGSNTTRLLVADGVAGGLLEVHQERTFTQIGRGLHADGTIPPAKLAEVVEAVHRQLQIARALGVGEVRAVATAAIRRAGNGQ